MLSDEVPLFTAVSILVFVEVALEDGDLSYTSTGDQFQSLFLWK